MMNTPSHRKDCHSQLESLDDARRALRQANTVEEIKAVRAKAESVRAHAQHASLGIEIQNFAAELKLQAERLGGQFLLQLKLRGGDRTASSPLANLRLKDLGIDKNQSARWQLAASVPEPMFRDFVRSVHSSGQEISSAGLLRLARHLRDGRLDEIVVNHQGPEESRIPHQVSTKSHLMTIGESEPEPRAPGVGELLDTVSEILCHHEMLTQVLDSVCHHAAVDRLSTDYRAVCRYLTEIKDHLHIIMTSLRRLDHDPVYRALMDRRASC
jgi:hypothetical protein